VKKIIFPLETLAWVSALAAAFTLAVNLAILGVLTVTWDGPPSPRALALLPLAFGPLVMFGLGFGWMFAALGVYLRDLRQISGLVVSVFLFATPIFYPIDAVPAPYDGLLLALNPLAGIVTVARDALFAGTVRSWTLVGGLWIGTAAFAALSSAFFMRLRKGFADVV
jgi:lipopolysaccharide transport system permease protein